MILDLNFGQVKNSNLKRLKILTKILISNLGCRYYFENNLLGISKLHKG